MNTLKFRVWFSRTYNFQISRGAKVTKKYEMSQKILWRDNKHQNEWFGHLYLCNLLVNLHKCDRFTVGKNANIKCVS